MSGGTGADVVILGGGPAGSALALALARAGASVTLLERSGYEEPRIGETVPPTFGALLAALGVEEDFHRGGHLRAHGTRSAWGSQEPGYHDFLFSGLGPGWHLERAGFDRMLAESARRRGVRLHTRAVLAAHGARAGGGWWLQVRDAAGNQERLETPFVVDATGRLGLFASARGATKVCFDELVAVSARFSLEPSALPEGLATVEAAPEGWWYHAALPGQQALVTYLSDADLVKAARLGSPEPWSRLLEGTRHILPRLARATGRSPLRLHSARVQCLDRVQGEDWLAVGDAACTLDPLSSGGISKALRSALAAAASLEEHLAGRVGALEAYARRVHGEFEAGLEARRHYYTQEARWPLSAFWKRRREALMLSPWQELRFVGTPEARRALERCAMYLPPRHLQQLALACTEPRLAWQVVRDFLAAAPPAISEQRVILALQHLVERGLLSAASARERTEYQQVG